VSSAAIFNWKISRSRRRGIRADLGLRHEGSTGDVGAGARLTENGVTPSTRPLPAAGLGHLALDAVPEGIDAHAVEKYLRSLAGS